MNTQNSDSLSPPSVQKEYEDPWNKLFIDLDAIKSNYEYLKSQLPEGVLLFAVLKSDAYGHDLVETGKKLAGAGCRHYAVDTPQEGIRLRNADVKGEILLMNPIPVWMAELSVRHDLSVSVIHESILEPLEEAAGAMDKTCRIHLNANIGLNRLGIAPSKISRIAKQAVTCSHLQMEGLFGQPRDAESATDSYQRLKDIYQDLKSRDIAPKYLHFANSTTFLAHPETIANGVRLGILMYGVLPPEQYSANDSLKELKPAMSLKTEIVQVRELPRGSRIGYRSNDKTTKDLTIGTIPIGYNHGLDRRAFREGAVLVRGKIAPFIGAISMNSSTIDVTGIEGIKIRDEVVIIGRQGNHEININELAIKSETIAAELMMRFGRSIPRDYVMDGSDVTSEIVLEQDTTDNIHIRYIQTENELPEWINAFDIVQFIHAHLEPQDDPPDIIAKVLDYAMSTHPTGKGFMIMATANRKLLGVVITIQFDKIDKKPENQIIYACVHKKQRKDGLGSRLIREAIDCAEGEIKIHLHKENPAVKLFDKLGFTNDYIEMSYLKNK